MQPMVPATEALDLPPIEELTRLQKEIKELKAVVAYDDDLYKTMCIQEAVKSLKETSLFRYFPDKSLELIAQRMERKVFPAGTRISREGICFDAAMVIAEGEVRRWATVEGREQLVKTWDPRSIGLLHVASTGDCPDEPAKFNAECTTDVIIYTIKREALSEVLNEDDQLSHYMLMALCEFISSTQQTFYTPVLEQRSHPISLLAVSVAAGVESFYRAAMNTFINARISGEIRGSLFPMMHVQVPVRMLYFAGLKEIRFQLEKFDTFVRHPLLLTCTPGIVMSPLISVLEAINAGYKNPEPLYRRTFRGYLPRSCREMIYAGGVNQISDYYTERIQESFDVGTHKHMVRGVGSIAAGVTAGYFSQFFHNLTQLKVMWPQKSYKEIFHLLGKSKIQYVPDYLPFETRLNVAKISAIFFPIGFIRRSLLIAGSFLIINGVTLRFHERRYIGVGGEEYSDG